MSDQALLLDSHVWLWLVHGEDQLGSETKAKILGAAERQALGVSAISFYELGAKAARGKLELLPDPGEWLKRASQQAGIGVIQVVREIMARAALLDLGNGDPIDRMLIATALFYQLELVTADRVILDYAEANVAFLVSDARK